MVLAFLDRTTLEYRMVETNGIQTIQIISNEVLEPITALDSEEFPPLAIGFKTHILDVSGQLRRIPPHFNFSEIVKTPLFNW